MNKIPHSRDRTVRTRACFTIRHKSSGRYWPQHKGEMIDLSDVASGRTIQLFFARSEASKAMKRIDRWNVPGEPPRSDQFEIVPVTIVVEP